MKKFTQTIKSIAIALLLLAANQSLIMAQSAAQPVGDGSVDSPYRIATLQNLYWVSQNSESWDKHFIQTKSINASSTYVWSDGEGWEPLVFFTGSYDGGGYTISGLTINRPNQNNQGLFGSIDGATIANLVLENVSIKGNNSVGGLLGTDNSFSLSTISNVKVSGSVEGNNNVGMLVGYLQEGEVHNCSSAGTVHGSYRTGGLVGYVFENSEIHGSFSTADIVVGNYAGGLVGMVSTYSQVVNSYYVGNVSAQGFAGGLVGSVHTNSLIINSYSVAEVSGFYVLGGLIGTMQNSTVTASFWDVEVSDRTSSAAGEGKSTEEMKAISTFISTGWDFKGSGEQGLWNIRSARNNGYPYLNWQFPNDNAPDQFFAPGVVIESVDDITSQAAAINIAITSTGNPSGNQYGICWSTEPNPTVNDFKTQEGEIAGVGDHTIQLDGLDNNTTFHIRAYAQNVYGINYSPQVTIITHEIDPVQPDGNGTQSDPFTISSLGNLLWLSQNQTMWGSHYLQTDDIDASSTAIWNNGKGWESIGYYLNGNNREPFTGSYNGGGHTINGLTISRPEDSYQGMFGYIMGASISNLVLNNISVYGNNSTGGLFGLDNDWTTISEVQNVKVSGNVTGVTNVGLLAGSARRVNVTNSSSQGIVRGDSLVGGMVGNIFSYVNIYESFSLAEVSGTSNVGGLVGSVGSNSSINSSYSNGSVTSDENRAGGLVGFLNNSSITNSYSIGEVSGASEVGGLVGGQSNSTVTASFWDTGASGQQESAAGEGKTTQQMQDLNTYVHAGWGIKSIGPDEVWNFGNGRNNNYPYLIWQFPDDPPPSDPIRAIISTLPYGNAESTSVIRSGEILFIGMPAATQHGICWSENEDPTLEDAYTTEGPVSESGRFTSSITGLNPGTTYYYRAYATNEEGTRYGDVLSFTTLEVGDLTLCEALDNCDLIFITGGDAEWYPQTDESSDGVDAASSGLITQNQKSWIETTIDGFGEVSFQWKAYTYTWGDYLRFYVNGVEQANISGNTDWQPVTHYLGAGSHTLRWEFDKTTGVDWGENKGWLDQVEFIEEDSYILTLDRDPDTGGETSGEGEYYVGEEVTVTATPADGYILVNWTNAEDDELSKQYSYTFVMPDEDITLTANFTDQIPTIQVSPEEFVLTINSGDVSTHTISVSNAGDLGSSLDVLISDPYKIFFEDFEDGINQWYTETYTSSEDLWHVSSQSPYSGDFSIWCGIEGTNHYDNGERINTAIISPYINLPLASSIELNFWESYVTEQGYDQCMVDISTDGGDTWIQLRGDGVSGNSGGWVNRNLDISGFSGEFVRIRFYFDTSDDIANTYPGWFVDDVAINNIISSWQAIDVNSFTVQDGLSHDVELTIDASGLNEGIYEEIITINSNDPNNNEILIPVTLHVTGTPEVTLSGSDLDFGYTLPSEANTLPLTIYNTGTAMLEISDIDISEAEFETNENQLSIEPGQMYTLMVTFYSNLPDDYSGELTFSTNVAGNESVSVPLTAHVPSCPNPHSLTAFNISNTSATLAWESVDQDITNLEWGAAGFIQGDGNTQEGLTQATLQLSSLDPGTYYDFYVQTHCSASDLSDWVGPYTFNTVALGSTCETAINLNQLTPPFSGTTTTATNDFSFCWMGDSKDLVFYHDVEDGAYFSIQLTGHNYVPRHTMRWGGECSGENEISCNMYTTPHSWTNTTGETQRVWFILGGWSNREGDFDLQWEYRKFYDLSLSSYPGDISPGLNGDGTYLEGNYVNISASNLEGYTFEGWSGSSANVQLLNNQYSQNTYFYMPDRNVSLTANYSIITYNISAIVNGAGSINPSGDVVVEHGSNSSYAIIPNTGYHIVDVEVDGQSVGPVTSYQFTNVTDNHSIEATFAINTYTITSSSGDFGSIDPEGVEVFNHGENQTYNIEPGLGNYIQDVKVDGISMGVIDSYTFSSIAADHTIHATFVEDEPDYHTITASAPGNGSITPSGDVTVAGGTDITFFFTPDANHVVADVLVGGVSVGAVESYTFSGVDANKTISVEFALSTYTLTYTAGENGSITGEASQTLTHGDDGTAVTAVSSEGFEFIRWSDGVTDNPRVDANVRRSASVTALFDALYTFTVIAEGSGTVEVDGDAYTNPITALNGTQLSLVAQPAEGWVFSGWSGDHTSSSRTTNVTLRSNMEVTAIFVEAPVVPDRYTLTVNLVGSGSVEVDGQAYARPISVEDGTQVTLVALPADGWEFVGWSGGHTTEEPTTSITMDTHRAVTATFVRTTIEPDLHTLTVSIAGSGSVEVDGQAYVGSITAEEGTNLPLVALPADGWEFSGWSGDHTSDDPSTTITMDADREVTATFTEGTSVSIEPLSQLVAFPNPFTGAITIRNAEDVVRVTITNLLGQTVMDMKVPGAEQHTLHTNHLIEGVYILTLYTGSGDSTYRRMLKKR